MFMKSIAAGVAGSALLFSVAFAQDTNTNATTEKTPSAASTTTTATSASGDWRASKVVGLKVYNDNNDSVGSINDLLMDKSGNIKLVVLGVGGFLGMGEHLVAVPFDKVKFSNESVSYTGTASNNSNNMANRPASSTTTGAATTTTPPASSTSSTSTSSSSSKWYPDHAVFNATKDELKSMPEFKYSE